MRTAAVSILLALSIAGVAAPAVAQAVAWQLRTLQEEGPALFMNEMVYDRARDEMVMVSRGQTWTYDGWRWTRIDVPGPPFDYGYEVAYDTSRELVVLMAARLNRDTQVWEWNGTSWTSQVTSARFRQEFSMAYDEARDEFLVFDGQSSALSRWKDGSWGTASLEGPAGREWAKLVYHPMRKSTLLVCGRRERKNVVFATWEWTGSVWIEHREPPQNEPLRDRIAFGAVYDSWRGRIVLFGGSTPSGSDDFNDTWEWNGEWVQRDPLVSADRRVCGFCGLGLPPIAFFGMAFDPARGRIVFQGGRIGSDVDATWEYRMIPNRMGMVADLGAGCASSAGVPHLATRNGDRPYVGETLNLALTSLPVGIAHQAFGIFGRSDTVWGSFTLPLALEDFGLPGCSLYLNPGVVVPLANNGGTANWSIPIPYQYHMLGFRFHLGGVVVDPGFNPGGLALSNALTVEVGIR